MIVVPFYGYPVKYPTSVEVLETREHHNHVGLDMRWRQDDLITSCDYFLWIKKPKMLAFPQAKRYIEFLLFGCCGGMIYTHSEICRHEIVD